MPAASTTSNGTDPTILIVEDDVGVRQLLSRMLGHLGARPTTALDTANAVAVAQAEPELALALIDLSLNGADGVTTARALQLVLPDLLIVLMSGDIAHLLAAQQLVGTPHILRKPFSLRDMAELVAMARCNPPGLKERYV